MRLFFNTRGHEKPHSPQGQPARKADTASSSEQLLDLHIANPGIMAEAERLLSGRTRDIRMGGDLKQAFLHRNWKYAASIIRSWMKSVVLLDLLLLFLTLFLLPRETAVAVAIPSLLIIPAALVVAHTWRKRRSELVLGSSLLGGMFVILLSVGWMGVAAGGLLLERYLHVMLLVAISGVVIFSIPLRLTLAIAVSAMALYLGFQLAFADSGPAMILSGFFFFGSGMAATVLGRRTMNKLAAKAFLLELRDRKHLSELAQSNRRLEQLSKVDGLTGTANRHLLRERMDELWRTESSVAMLMCDIDDFKALNDHLGHLEGDRCLVEVARIIMACTRSEVDCVARFGGEEFLVLLPDVTEADAMSVAERIRSAVVAAGLANPLARVKPIVTISIGVAVGQTTLPSELLQKRADVALYFAKRTGKNQVRLWSQVMESNRVLGSVA